MAPAAESRVQRLLAALPNELISIRIWLSADFRRSVSRELRHPFGEIETKGNRTV
jgi:hypothetical protein